MYLIQTTPAPKSGRGLNFPRKKRAESSGVRRRVNKRGTVIIILLNKNFRCTSPNSDKEFRSRLLPADASARPINQGGI